MKSWELPTNEMIEKVLTTVKKETDRQYFFSRLYNPLWAARLQERGYFDNPPEVRRLPDGSVQFPYWPEMSYLINIAEEASAQVIEIVLALPKISNPRIYDDILRIALKIKGRESARLLPKLIEYTQLEYQFLAHRYPDLLQHWVSECHFDEALEIVKRLIPFREDPKIHQKQQSREKNADVYGASLKPAPLLDSWEYQQFLEEGVRILALHIPYQVACFLIDAVANMIQLSMHQEDFDKGMDEDYSEIWCRRLGKSPRVYYDSREILVLTLTYACELVYDKAPESITALNHLLKSQRWKVFKRLRQQLYSSHLNEQTLPWIRELILEYDDYSKWKYPYEFQIMLRKASEKFGTFLLSEDKRTKIFEDICDGPSKSDFKEWAGKDYSEEVFQQYQRDFHREQLCPFGPLFSERILSYFNELESDDQAKPITDDNYSPFGEVAGGFVSYRSPKRYEELECLVDEELLTYLNVWGEKYWEKEGGLVEVNVSALASVFQSLFKNEIVTNNKRLAFWVTNRDKIARPIYVANIVKAMQEFIKGKNFENLDQCLEFCLWVLSHQDLERVEGQPTPQDESRDHPDWRSSRRAVVDFISTCVDEDTNAPITARKGLADLLSQVCNQFDWRLDCGQPVLISRDDQATEGINNIRSRALEALVYFCLWIRRHEPENTVPELKNILSKRLIENCELPLTRPEHALLGMHFKNLCFINKDWALENINFIFPQKNIGIWRDAFGSYIRFRSPDRIIFEFLHREFEYALENLSELNGREENSRELVDRLGQHLFTHYLWEAYPLRGDGSLLERFYEKTANDRKRWSELFSYVGYSLRHSGSFLDRILIDRITTYFNWRFETAEPLELKEFTFWLEAECLDPIWRLQSYSRILDFVHGDKNPGTSLQIRALHRLLSKHQALVVECFAKITNAMAQDTQVYISTDESKLILQAGLKSEDHRVRQNAERAREKLLRLGRFDFLNVTD